MRRISIMNERQECISIRAVFSGELVINLMESCTRYRAERRHLILEANSDATVSVDNKNTDVGKIDKIDLLKANSLSILLPTNASIKKILDSQLRL